MHPQNWEDAVWLTVFLRANFARSSPKVLLRQATFRPSVLLLALPFFKFTLFKKIESCVNFPTKSPRFTFPYKSVYETHDLSLQIYIGHSFSTNEFSRPPYSDGIQIVKILLQNCEGFPAMLIFAKF